MFFVLSHLALLTFGSGPALCAQRAGRDVGALVAADVRVISQVRLDVTLDEKPERIALLGKSDADGIIVPQALAVVTGEKPVTLLDSVWLPTGAATSVTLQSSGRDLDGDGKVEIVLEAATKGPGLVQNTTYFYRLQAGRLVLAYSLASNTERGGERERRTLLRSGPDGIVERIETRGATWDASLHLGADGRYVPGIVVRSGQR